MIKNFALVLITTTVLFSCTSPEKKGVDTILSLEKSFYSDSTNSPDKTKSREIISAYVDFAKNYPDNAEAPFYLFKAGEIANGILNTPMEAIEYYGMIYEKYPEHEKAAVALFLKGFVFENKLKNTDNARLEYTEFLQKFPSHKLAGDVKFSLEHLGMSDEDLIKMFEEKNKTEQTN